jgi:hypothetical protein
MAIVTEIELDAFRNKACTLDRLEFPEPVREIAAQRAFPPFKDTAVQVLNYLEYDVLSADRKPISGVIFPTALFALVADRT